jgi:formyl-CoA transferase
MQLADLGADVIKVEQPGRGDETRQWGPPYVGGEAGYYLAVNRNKRSITLDLKHPRGQDVLRQLAARSDVLVENFKVGTLERLGLGYDHLSQDNPGLVHCSITGYGPDGPYRDRPGYDFIAQGMGGLMSVTGELDGQPLKHGIAITDLFTGLYAVVGIQAALREREHGGRGQRVDVSLLESAVAMLVNVATNYLLTGNEPRRYGNAHPNIVPYQVFDARDKPFIVAVGNDEQFRRLCQVLGRDDLPGDERFATNPARTQHRQALVGILGAEFAHRDAAAWVEALLGVGVPAGPINAVSEVFADPQVLFRGMLAEVPHPTAGVVRMAGIPLKLSETPADVRRHPPLLGEHTEQVLREVLGMGQDEVEQLRADGVV